MTFVSYDFLHGLGRIQPAKTYELVQSQVRFFADTPAPQGLGFHLDLRFDRGEPLDSLYWQLCERYGWEHKTQKGHNISTGESYRGYQWQLNQGQFDKAFAYLDQLQQNSPLFRERSSLVAWWSFKFLDFETRAVLPGQDGFPNLDVRLGDRSFLSLTMGAKVHASAWFLLPFAEISPEFLTYARRLQLHLPFTFLAKHWRIWKKSPSGEWRPRRFDPKL